MITRPARPWPLFALSLATLVSLALPTPIPAQQSDTGLFQEMRWRMIGPFRGGRTVGAAGVPTQPNVFYIGVNNGGVWKTTDFGRTWAPIFDDQPTGSIGDVAVAPSDPNVVYVGTGEGIQRPDLATGMGMFRSSDAGKTWKYLGLSDAQQIGSVAVDPINPNRVFVAVLGHPYGPNAERGVFRSLNGGETWEKVLYHDENTGAIQVVIDPSNPQVIYADLWAGRYAPWEAGPFNGPGSGLYKSTDGGTTWHPLTKGLPTIAEGLGRIGVSIARSEPNRLYANVDAETAHGGTYRSDDGGESWSRVNSEGRVWGRGMDFAEVEVDPKNADIIYVANTSTYKSIDGGKTFHAIKGAPGGDDYHRIWINPNNPEIILIASDQGATISVNAGQTWSSWYNQPTAQFYHVVTDNQFPYWVCGGQQESGSACVRSRGDHGAISFRDWYPVGVEEYGYVAPDPLHPNLIYGGKATVFDRNTFQTQNVGPEAVRSGKYRFVRTMPIIFSPVDQRTLYLASNVLFKTTNGGHSWEVISPDLTRESPEVPKNLGAFTGLDPEKGKHRGVIYSIAPSFQTVRTIWAGTEDGLIHLTRDGGKSWKNVTPSQLVPWAKVAQLEASHFDTLSAYAAINTFRLDDLNPHVYRTHDGGKTWQEIATGLPKGAIINTVREDPVRKGLLFAGSENAVYVSFNDGDRWYPLRVNMPATSIRDLVIHENDVVVGTHGRGFWILDDITPLRQLTPEAVGREPRLFKPATGIQVRRNNNPDTPLPPEEPVGQNPPDGVLIHYFLPTDAMGTVTLEILDGNGRVVRRFASDDQADPIDEKSLAIPLYWIRPARVLPGSAGLHRFVWDLHGPAPKVGNFDYPIAANYGDTPRHPLGVAMPAGQYTVRMTLNGKSQTEPLIIKMDPRVKTPAAGLARKFSIESGVVEMLERQHAALDEVRAARKRAQQAREATGSDTQSQLEKELADFEGTSRRFGPRSSAPSLGQIGGDLAGLLDAVSGADATPTTQAEAAFANLKRALAEQLKQWTQLKAKVLKSGAPRTCSDES